MKKFIAIIFSLCLFSSTQVFATNNPIIANFDINMTNQLGYPIVKIHNSHSEEILVEYNYFLDENKSGNEDFIELNVILQPNETKELHLKDLAFLNGQNKTRNILFSYNFRDNLKPTQLTLQTPIFNSEGTVYPELG